MWVSLRRFCFFFRQKTAYELRISDWSSDVCSSDLALPGRQVLARQRVERDAVIDRLRGGRPRLLRRRAARERKRQSQYDRAHHKEIGRASCRERGCQYV